jgi:hypothetical protein
MRRCGFLVVVSAATAALAVGIVGRADARTRLTCPRTVKVLVNKVSDIDARLDIGVTLSRYEELVSGANVALGRIAIRSLSSTCISRVGTPAENALNSYKDAYRSWLKCREWYESPEVQTGIEWGYKPPTCERGPGHGYELRQRLWSSAHLNVRRALETLG